MLSIDLGFPIGKRVTDQCSILVLEAVGFSHSMDCTDRDIFTKGKLLTLFPRKVLHENTALLAENFHFSLLTQLLKKINKVIFV